MKPSDVQGEASIMALVYPYQQQEVKPK